jgi:hypothetical protein
MTRRGDKDEVDALEAIDLGPEIERAASGPAPRRAVPRSGLRVGAVAIAVVGALLVSLAVANRSSHSDRSAPPSTRATAPAGETSPSVPTSVAVTRPRGRIPGRYYPALDHADTAALTLPSGRTVTLSGDLTNLVGGLGATFGGSVVKRDQPDSPCCLVVPVNFQIFHAAPNVFFETRRTGVVSTPLILTPAQARTGVDSLRGGEYRFALLSTGDWTLIVSLLNYQAIVSTGVLHGWHLRSTPNGAVLDLPADSTIAYDSVTLGSAPNLSERDVVMTENGCPASSRKARTLNQSATHGSWCQHGLLVRIEGPQSYVGVAVANLGVKLTPIH